MIVEVRTYQLKPGTLVEAEKRFAAALPVREKHSRLAAFWHTEVGALNQIIHVWTYDSFAQRTAVRAAASKVGGLNKWVHIWAYKDAAERQRIRADAVARGLWPPGSGATGAIVAQENMLVAPASFSPIR